MRTAVVKRWQWVHRWSSLACTLFLLVLCATGLPLVFADEIEAWTGDAQAYAALPPDAPRAGLDGLVARSLRRYPGQIVTSIFIDDDEQKVVVSMAPSWQLAREHPRSNHALRFDARTGELIAESGSSPSQSPSGLQLIRRLHVDLFAGLPGMLFLAVMGMLFVAALVSGVALYAPFMRHLEFGAVRTTRSPRTRWLDRHNLLGIATLAWALAIGITGVFNELSTPLFRLWQQTQVEPLLASRRNEAQPSAHDPSSQGSVDAALAIAQQSLPAGMQVLTIGYPGGPLGSPRDYLLWAKGNTPVSSRLFTPMLVSVGSPAELTRLPMPWYLRALGLSRPLHFGDYGGMPLKVLWAALDLLTLCVLGSGLYLWLGKTRRASTSTQGARRRAPP